MKQQLTLAGASVLATLGILLLPSQAQACPYKLVNRYVYNALTQRMEMRATFEVDYIRCNRPAETPEGHTPTGYAITVSTADGEPLRVYAGPGRNHSVVGTIPNGTFLPLTGHMEGDWFQLLDGNWVYSDEAR